jgi:hypothetical protein
MEWSSPGRHSVVVPWTLIDGPQSAAAFAAGLQAAPLGRWQATSISSALLYSALLLDDEVFRGRRRVVDISGDGPNNMGLPVQAAREDLLRRGITINGLPIDLGGPDPLRDGPGVGIEAYYAECVIGGEGAFIVPVDGTANFAEAIRRKLLAEIAWQPSSFLAASIPVQSAPEIDCRLGEGASR